MVFIKLSLFLFLLSGCGLTYYTKIAFHQMSILWKAEEIEDALQDPNLSQKEKEKLKLIHEVRKFGFEKLGLKSSDNYTSYSKLDDKYVSYVVNANPLFDLKPYKWWYPIVGELSYKGFPQKQQAEELEQEMIKKSLDVNLRGVTAYSTLGWFNDPVLSSMMNYPEVSLVNLILHESTHATIYIKSNAEFNEQLATFVGNKGTEIFFQDARPELVAKIKAARDERKLFYTFIADEKKKLQKLYDDENFQKLPLAEKLEKKKEKILSLQSSYRTRIRKKIKVLNFDDILRSDLNNAHLALYGTYTANQELFEQVYLALGSDFKKLLNHLKSYEDSKDPLKKLKSSSKIEK
ncbi:MAG: aminopeptidase [Bdellovibrionota bacterium]